MSRPGRSQSLLATRNAAGASSAARPKAASAPGATRSPANGNSHYGPGVVDRKHGVSHDSREVSTRALSDALPLAVAKTKAPVRKSTHVPDTAVGARTRSERERSSKALDRPHAQTDRRIVITAVVAFAALILAVVVTQTDHAMAQSKAKVEVTGTLERVSQDQGDFRSEFGRFATWPELLKRGARLPATQQVVRATATASHWYMQVRDVETGMMCDRIHELADEANVKQSPPNCRVNTESSF